MPLLGHYKGNYVGSQAGAQVNLNPFAFPIASDPVSPYDSRIGLRMNIDGYMYQYTQSNGSLTIEKQNELSDWILPHASASTAYEGRLIVNSGSSPNYLSDSVSTWIALGSGSQSTQFLQWILRSTVEGNPSGSWNFQIRKDGGVILDQMTLNVSISNGGF